MKKIILLIAFFLAFSFNTKAKKNPLKIFGTVYINDSTFMNKTEVTVKDWIEFIVNNDFDTTLFPIPKGLSENVSIIFEEIKNNKEQKFFHFENETNQNYNYNKVIIVQPTRFLKNILKNDSTNTTLSIPITGITFEQANRFCTWKETVLNTRKTIKIKLNLPSVENYKIVIPNKDSLNVKKCALYNWAFCNCVTIVNKKLNKLQGKGLVDVYTYWPSDLGLYNLQGNASEMTSTEGIAMGGSFRHIARESYNDKIQTYKTPEDWLGFRYIITLQ